MKIMFQGDSITDACRDRSDNHLLAGFSQCVKDILKDKYEYVNYGISGDTSRMLVARHKEEFEKENPDILTILIGINDIWRYYDGRRELSVLCDEYISNVEKVIGDSKKINPNCRIILLEPYLLPGDNHLQDVAYEMYLKNRNALREKFVNKVDSYIILNEEMYEAYNKGIIYSDDGVHPNEKGQLFIAQKIIEVL